MPSMHARGERSVRNEPRDGLIHLVQPSGKGGQTAVLVVVESRRLPARGSGQFGYVSLHPMAVAAQRENAP